MAIAPHAKAETRHHTQYFEMFGHRSIYHDGWRAVCPVPGSSFTQAGVGFGQLEITEEKLRGWMQEAGSFTTWTTTSRRRGTSPTRTATS
jgi:arylsulfatase A-like enzyme